MSNITEKMKSGTSLIRKKGLVSGVREIIEYFYWKVFHRESTQTLRLEGEKVEFYKGNKTSIDRTRERLNRNKTLQKIISELEPDDVFLDVGANTGLYSCFAAKKCANGEVIAFEPYPPNISELRKNAAMNGNNIKIRNEALSNKNGTDFLSVPERRSPGYGMAAITGESNEKIKVKTIRGDTLFAEGDLPQPTVVKIDVEGAEALVVDGLEKTLRNEKCRLVECEVHLPSKKRPSIDKHGYTPSDLEIKFNELGFSVVKMNDHGGDFSIIAQKGNGLQ